METLANLDSGTRKRWESRSSSGSRNFLNSFYLGTHKQYWRCWPLVEVCTFWVLLFPLVFHQSSVKYQYVYMFTEFVHLILRFFLSLYFYCIIFIMIFQTRNKLGQVFIILWHKIPVVITLLEIEKPSYYVFL